MSTSIDLFKEIKKYFNKNISNTYVKNIDIIQKICNIPVKCILIIKTFEIEIVIKSLKILYGKKKKDYNIFNYTYELHNFSIKSLDKFLKKFKEIIYSLKFDKLHGKLYSEKISNNKLFNNIFNTDFIDSNECSVCLEKTITLTNCLHSLCIECWSSLKEIKCPLCRKKCNYIYNINDFNALQKKKRRVFMINDDTEIQRVLQTNFTT